MSNNNDSEKSTQNPMTEIQTPSMPTKEIREGVEKKYNSNKNK